MGNDGGSIPDRRDLVRTKGKAEQADKANQTRAQWFFCALSKKPLQKPVVACELGKLYNKDAIVEYLLDKSLYGDGQRICGHIRSLKDVKTLNLTSNPSPTLPPGSELPFPPFVCPLTMKEMLGTIPFIFLWSCGCVFSKNGLKTIGTPVEEFEKEEDKEAAAEGDSEKENKESKPAKIEKPIGCPQCGKPYLPSQVIPLNPPSDEAAAMLSALLARRAAEPASGKSKKRKAAAAPASEQPDSKRPSLGPSIAQSAVAVLLKEEEKKRVKTGMSAAIKSLYRSKDEKEKKETFLTMNTFTRYA